MLKLTKWGIWGYFLLLIFEGALRKWIVPGMADILLVVRDPVVFAIYAGAIAAGRIPRNPFIGFIAAMAGASVVFSFMAGQSNLVVLAYGIRTNYLHLPLIFVMAEVLDREDVEKMGTWVLLLGLANAALMVQQFRSSSGAWVNVGVGGEEGTQIHGAGGRIRPPGFFSFIIGPTVFLPIFTAFILHQASAGRRVWFPVLIACGLGLAVALPVSISRGTMIAALLVGATFTAGLLRLGLLNMAMVRLALVSLGVLAALSFTPVFDEARSAFMDRWTIAANESGGRGWGSLIDRVAGVAGVPVYYLTEAPLFGHGVGYGSSVAARLLTGKRGFLLAEDEWSKCYLELGPLLGSAFLIFRVLLVAYLFKLAWKALNQHRDTLPLMLWAAVAPTTILFYQWAQPTVLGFAAFGGGLIAASVNYVDDEDEDEDDEEDEEDDSGDEEQEETPEPESPLQHHRRRMRGL